MDKPKRRRKRKSDSDALPKSAPGHLQIVQDFLNTWNFDTRTDALPSPEKLQGWLVERELLDAEAVLTKADLRRARDFRTLTRALLVQSLGYEVKPDVINRFGPAIQGACPQFSFSPAGETHIVPGDFDQALGHLVALVVMSRVAGLWERFKICGNCQSAFYDYSNNRGGRWCTKRCGDRFRAERHQRLSRKYEQEYQEWRQQKIENFAKFLREVARSDREPPFESAD